MKVNIKTILAIVLASLAAIFLIQNVAAVDVRFLFWKLAISRALLILFALVAGFILGWFAHQFLRVRNV